MATRRLKVIHGFGLPSRALHTNWLGIGVVFLALLGLLLSLDLWLTRPAHDARDEPPPSSTATQRPWPMQQITCLDWEGQPFSLLVSVSTAKADEIAETIERGMTPPYQPTCTVEPTEPPLPE